MWSTLKAAMVAALRWVFFGDEDTIDVAGGIGVEDC